MVVQELLQVGDQLGRTLAGKWTLVRLVGTGGMGGVYEARHRNGRRCAIKLLHERFLGDLLVTERFLREGSVANAVDHPNVVAIEDEGHDERGRPFLVMELLRGESLDARLGRAGGKLDLPEALPLIAQLLEILEKAHSVGVVHRDIKPSNLFIVDSGRLKVLDFGVAQATQLLRESTLTTRWGDVLGTPAYMSPEQALGLWEQVDATTDIWAVGATMYRMLSGRAVHMGRTPNEQLARAMTASARPLFEVAPQVPRGLCSIVDKALAFEREERFQSAGDLLRSLQTYIAVAEGSLGLAATEGSLGTAPGPRSARSVKPLGSSRFSWKLATIGAASTGLGLGLPVWCGPASDWDHPVVSKLLRESPQELSYTEPRLARRTASAAEAGPFALAPPEDVGAALAAAMPPTGGQAGKHEGEPRSAQRHLTTVPGVPRESALTAPAPLDPLDMRE